MSAIDYKNGGRPALPAQQQRATEKQIDFINSLLTRHEMTDTNRRSVEAALLRGIDKVEASQIIDWIKALPRKATPSAKKTEDVNLEGMHRLNGDIYKVQVAVHGSGRLYAKKLTQHGDDWSFEFAPGVIYKLSSATKMTLEQAKEFGALYGTCCVCGRTLTNEESIAEGIGPICGSRF